MRREVAGKKGHKFLILGFILVLALGVVGCSNGGDKEIVAKVNDEAITKDELYNILVEQGGEQIIESLIAEKIVDAEAKKADIKITDKDIDEEFNKMVEESGGEAQFEQVMAYYGTDKEEMKKNIKTNLKIKALVSDRITVSDDEIKAYFEKNEDQFEQAEEVRARHILVEDEEEANKIYKELQDGGNFEELAKKHSKDGSAEQGGDLGFFGRGEMVEEFEEASFSLEIGKVSEPVKTTHGYHIIKVEEKKEAVEAKLEGNEEKIEDLVFESKVSDAYREWYQEIYPEYKVENKITKKK